MARMHFPLEIAIGTRSALIVRMKDHSKFPSRLRSCRNQSLKVSPNTTFRLRASIVSIACNLGTAWDTVFMSASPSPSSRRMLFLSDFDSPHLAKAWVLSERTLLMK